jgi:hypothetical protein
METFLEYKQYFYKHKNFLSKKDKVQFLTKLKLRYDSFCTRHSREVVDIFVEEIEDSIELEAVKRPKLKTKPTKDTSSPRVLGLDERYLWAPASVLPLPTKPQFRIYFMYNVFLSLVNSGFTSLKSLSAITGINDRKTAMMLKEFTVYGLLRVLVKDGRMEVGDE